MNDQGIKYDDRVAKAVEKRELLKRTPVVGMPMLAVPGGMRVTLRNATFSLGDHAVAMTLRQPLTCCISLAQRSMIGRT